MDVGVRLTVVPSQGEADVICGLLRVNGIPCEHREAGNIEMLGGLWHEVLVPEERLAEARELLASEDATPPP
jgi:Putative prokaryotic signal transducing protein